ncbi:MAG: hypothetical protein PHS53_04050 [Candidatus Pacebacteria bacterium]|nr:hypothetical protein [Candidatus Paceibacterota bacterium]MDD5357291.1 hypothetical protein [Candidatus Paceibacterota bacterium]
MSEKKLGELYKKFLAVANTEGEDAARKFLTDHFSDFPEDIQSKITSAFFEESLQDEALEKKQITGIQTEALDAMSQLEKMKRVLEDALRIKNLQSELSS